MGIYYIFPFWAQNWSYRFFSKTASEHLSSHTLTQCVKISTIQRKNFYKIWPFKKVSGRIRKKIKIRWNFQKTTICVFQRRLIKIAAKVSMLGARFPSIGNFSCSFQPCNQNYRSFLVSRSNHPSQIKNVNFDLEKLGQGRI